MKEVDMDGAIELHERRLNDHRDALLRLAGETRAMKFVVDTLIASHPAPAELERAYQRMLYDVTAEISDSQETTDAQRLGWKSVLAHYSALLQARSHPDSA